MTISVDGRFTPAKRGRGTMGGFPVTGQLRRKLMPNTPNAPNGRPQGALDSMPRQPRVGGASSSIANLRKVALQRKPEMAQVSMGSGTVDAEPEMRATQGSPFRKIQRGPMNIDPRVSHGQVPFGSQPDARSMLTQTFGMAQPMEGRPDIQQILQRFLGAGRGMPPWLGLMRGGF